MNAGPGAARIGPNAIIQVADALELRVGGKAARDLLSSVGLGAYVDAPPSEMVEELEVIALHSAVRARLPPRAALGVARAAGLATGDYLLAHRIPRIAQWVLRALPAAPSSRLLLAAIMRHAWTFAGSARFMAQHGNPILIRLENCPICRGAQSAAPLCEYYAAAFTRLFSSLVHPRAVARETVCAASGGPACQFEVNWRI
jgi:divinyl protochlorophyllide a 8-vinyl-reductase